MKALMLAAMLTSTIASAEPATTLHMSEPEPASAYGEAGIAQIDDHIAAEAFVVGAGKHLVGPLWLHGEGLIGAPSSPLFLDEGNSPTYSGTYLAVRTGLEARGCVTIGCIVGGADVGFRHMDYALMSTANQPFVSRISHDTPIAVARVGLDVGGRNIRFRPTLEGSYDFTSPPPSDSAFGLAMILAIAYQR